MTDALLELPDGLQGLITELEVIDPGLVKVDPDTLEPIGFNINIIAQDKNDLDIPQVILVRIPLDTLELLSQYVITQVPTGGLVIALDEETTIRKTVYDLVVDNPVKLSQYEGYSRYLPYLDNFGLETASDHGPPDFVFNRNPKAWPTIEVDDGQGNTVEIPNPQYKPIKEIGRWF